MIFALPVYPRRILSTPGAIGRPSDPTFGFTCTDTSNAPPYTRLHPASGLSRELRLRRN